MSNKTTSSVPGSNIYLDCPYSEKDQAKVAGARWDESAKQWYVPPDLFSVIDRFNQWRPNGKVYLNCLFEQKDEAKKAGAKWDPILKRWCVIVKEHQAVIPAKFSKWLTKHNVTTQSPAKKRKDAAENSSSSSGDKRKRGNAQDAALLRVNDNMTVAQLHEECRFRKITGMSGKKKDWLLQQLKSGTVWQSAMNSSSSAHPMSSSKLLKSSDQKIATNASAPAAKKAKKIVSASASTRKVTDKDSHKISPSSVKKKVVDGKTTKSPIKAVRKVADEKDKKKEAATMKKSVAPNPAYLTRLPRVTSSLTVCQLSHEFSYRHPNTKGISNKSKTWFLDELGEDSVWTTSPDISRDLSNVSLVSKNNMTVAQLQHELMTRSPSTHNKGMSNKSKADLVKLAGVGSIWMTASLQETESKTQRNEPMLVSAAKKEPASEKKPPIVKMATSATNTTTATKEAASKSVTKTKKLESAAKKERPKKETANSKTKNDAATLSTAKKTMKKPSPKKEKPAVKMARPVKKQNISEAKEEDISQSVTQTKKPELTTKKKPPSNTKNVAKSQPLTIMLQAPSSSNLLPLQTFSSSMTVPSVKRSPNQPSKIDPLMSKKVKIESIPVVSSHMTVAQLKGELKGRDPNIKGFSAKGKDWLISQLGEGTEVRGSAQYMAKADAKAAALHCHHTQCHIHPLSDSAALRAPVTTFGSTAFKKRVHVGSCNVGHRFTCRKTAYRTCEPCDYDICKACYEIESLSPREKDQELNNRRDEAFAKEAAMQRQWAEQERMAEERHQQEEQRFNRKRVEELNESHGYDLKRFPDNVRNPKAVHKDEANKLKYAVWTCDVHRKQSGCDVCKAFNSSYATLKEANLRVEFVFYYSNPWGCDKDEMHADEDEDLVGGLRRMSSQPDGGGSLTVSVLPSEVFDILEPQEQQGPISYAGLYGFGHGHCGGQQKEPRKENQFSNSVRNPPTKHTDEQNKLKYVVWQSCGYGDDGWHSFGGPPEKTFNSSYATLKEANERVEYAFYYQNPWGLQGDELPHAETDKVSDQGFRFLECTPDDSECWTVSVVPSTAFDYINL